MRTALLLLFITLTACGKKSDCREAVAHMYEVLEVDTAQKLGSAPTAMRSQLEKQQAAIARDRENALARCDGGGMTKENHDCLMRAVTLDGLIQCGGFK